MLGIYDFDFVRPCGFSAVGWATYSLLSVGAKKLSGTIFHVSPEGVKHMDMLNNSFARFLFLTLRRYVD